MTTTLQIAHKTIGVEVRRGRYDIELDGTSIGSVKMNDTFEAQIEPGRHTLRVQSGRNFSPVTTFHAADDETIAFRCTGKSILPIFLASFLVPRLALRLHRE